MRNRADAKRTNKPREQTNRGNKQTAPRKSFVTFGALFFIGDSRRSHCRKATDTPLPGKAEACPRLPRAAPPFGSGRGSAERRKSSDIIRSSGNAGTFPFPVPRPLPSQENVAPPYSVYTRPCSASHSCRGIRQHCPRRNSSFRSAAGYRLQKRTYNETSITRAATAHFAPPQGGKKTPRRKAGRLSVGRDRITLWGRTAREPCPRRCSYISRSSSGSGKRGLSPSSPTPRDPHRCRGDRGSSDRRREAR